MLIVTRRKPALGILMVLMAATSLAAGTTIRQVGFREMVDQAGYVVRAQVIESRQSEKGQPPASVEGEAPAAKTSGSPAKEPAPRVEDPEDAGASASEAMAEPEPPAALPVEGGRMPFLTIVLSVEDAVKGDAPPVMTLRVPGGVSAGRRVHIPGLPEFKEGSTYLLYLRPDFDRVGDPVVGVNQGFFEIVKDPASGEEQLLDFRSDLVIAVEENRVISRLNPGRKDVRRAATSPSPTPDPGYEVSIPSGAGSKSPRYWNSTEKPMTPDRLIDLTRSILGR
jgi:hypothetical protein